MLRGGRWRIVLANEGCGVRWFWRLVIIVDIPDAECVFLVWLRF